MNYQQILDEIYKDIKPELKRDKVASYIPALANVKKSSLHFLSF
jgi:glutaminase